MRVDEIIKTPYSGNPLVSGVKCEQCGITQEKASTPLNVCAGCHKVCYCSRDCQIKLGKANIRKFVSKLPLRIEKRG